MSNQPSAPELLLDSRPRAEHSPRACALPSPATDDELRKLGREIVRLGPRTVDRLSLSPELMEVVEEWGRVGGKRGSGSAKKGKARLEGLLAQCARSSPPRPPSCAPCEQHRAVACVLLRARWRASAADSLRSPPPQDANLSLG